MSTCQGDEALQYKGVTETRPAISKGVRDWTITPDIHNGKKHRLSRRCLHGTAEFFVQLKFRSHDKGINTGGEQLISIFRPCTSHYMTESTRFPRYTTVTYPSTPHRNPTQNSLLSSACKSRLGDDWLFTTRPDSASPVKTNAPFQFLQGKRNNTVIQQGKANWPQASAACPASTHAGDQSEFFISSSLPRIVPPAGLKPRWESDSAGEGQDGMVIWSRLMPPSQVTCYSLPARGVEYDHWTAT